jgi:hypothetical protein
MSSTSKRVRIVQDDSANNNNNNAAAAAADPLQAEMARLEDEASGRKAAREQAAAAEKQQREMAQKRAEAEWKRRELELKEREQAHKHHLASEKLRMEQMKVLGKAGKAGADARGEQEASRVADTVEARDDAIRKIMQLREELGARGSGKRITIDTPLPMLLAEMELCHTQLNLERAREMPEAMLLSTLQALETATAPIADCRGTTEDFRSALEASRAAQPNSLDSHLDRAMRQACIKYQHWFAVSPELYLISTIGKLASARYQQNRKVRDEAGDRNLSEEVEARMRAFEEELQQQ